MSAEEQTFEQAQAELEQIVQRLEQGEASLDEAPELFARLHGGDKSLMKVIIQP